MAQSDERTLVARAREGDKKAFSELVQAHHRRAYRLAVHLLANAAEADDIVQDAFVRALRGIDRFDGRSEFGTWLHRIVVNLCLNAMRVRKRTSAVDPDDPRLGGAGGTDPSKNLEQRRTYERLAKALDGLSPTLRTTIVLVAIQGLPHKEAAQVLGCSEGTVAWRVHEGRRRLRDAMGDEAPGGAKPPKPDAGDDGKDDTDEGWE